ncbi:hypothetical protein Tco_0332592 [Tanacetum coccineum]
MLAPRSAKAWHTSIPGKLHGIRNLPGSPSFSGSFLRSIAEQFSFNGILANSATFIIMRQTLNRRSLNLTSKVIASCETNVEALILNVLGNSSPLIRKLYHGTFDYHVVKDMEFCLGKLFGISDSRMGVVLGKVVRNIGFEQNGITGCGFERYLIGYLFTSFIRCLLGFSFHLPFGEGLVDS